MKQFKFDKKLVSKVIRESLDKLMLEELGIADEVVMKTNALKKIIYNDSRNGKKQKLDNGVSLVNGDVIFNIFGEEFTVFYKIYNYYNYETYYEKSDYFSPQCNVLYDAKQINLSILSISGEFQENSFGDSIQHELEHMYQIKMQGKGLFQDNNMYEKAISNINSDLYNGWVSKLANIIYYSRNEEHDAFVNGLYQQLIDPNAFGVEDYIIKTSTPYKISLMLNAVKNEIKDNYENEDLNQACVFFKKPRRWFVSQCEIGIRKIIKKIMKVRTKAKNDFFKINNNTVYEIFNLKNNNELMVEKYYDES